MPVQSVPFFFLCPLLDTLSGLICQWLAGIKFPSWILLLDKSFPLATSQSAMFLLWIWIPNSSVTLTTVILPPPGSGFLSACCALKAPLVHQAGWSHWSLYWEGADLHAADMGFPWRRCSPTPFWRKPQHMSCVPHKHSASWYSVSCMLHSLLWILGYRQHRFVVKMLSMCMFCPSTLIGKIHKGRDYVLYLIISHRA